MHNSYTTRRGRASIRKILDCDLYTYTRNYERVTGQGPGFAKQYPCRPIYFTDQDRLRSIGESLAAIGGRRLLNEAFGDLIDRNVCVGYAWDGLAGFRK